MQGAVGRGIGARRPRTSFVGRRLELDQLRSLITRNRLVTITGPGGSGKTRLAEEFVAGATRSLRDGVAFAYLAEACGPMEVTVVIASSVGLHSRAGDLIEALVDYLREGHLLLIIDNCEHVRDTAARVVERLLDSCPGLTVLATSRRPLQVPGEQLFPIDGLLEDAAMALFVDRARMAIPSFVLLDSMRSLLADLCTRLDGMPLAIELAASRARNLELSELASRVAGHLADLGSGGTVAPARQRTLRDTISWSHDLLGEGHRVLWRRLCVFSGGFTLAAAEEVAACAPLGRDDIERLLGELVDHSMVVFDPRHARYRIIEAMREYGLERLREADEVAAFQTRQRDWVLRRAEDADRRWFGPDQPEILDEMDAEAGNLRAALESSDEVGAFEVGLRIATASLWYWVTQASLAEAARWYGAFLDRMSDPALEARASWRAGYVAVLQGRHADARGLLERSDRLAVETGDAATRAYARNITCLRVLYEQSGEDALALARETLADPAADEMCRCWALIGIGLASFLIEDWEETRRVSLVGIELCRGVGESWNQELHLRSLAYAQWRLGAADAAESALLDALRIDRRLDDLWHLAWTTETLGWVSVDLGRPERAARLLGIAAGYWAQTGSWLAGPWRAFHEASLERLRGRLGDRRLAREMELGVAMDRVQGLAFALDERPSVVVGSGDSGGLSPREIEVTSLVAEGLGNHEIADRLFLSPRTVEKHVENVMNKLSVDSRAQIAAWYARRESDTLPT